MNSLTRSSNPPTICTSLQSTNYNNLDSSSTTPPSPAKTWAPSSLHKVSSSADPIHPSQGHLTSLMLPSTPTNPPHCFSTFLGQCHHFPIYVQLTITIHTSQILYTSTGFWTFHTGLHSVLKHPWEEQLTTRHLYLCEVKLDSITELYRQRHLILTQLLLGQHLTQFCLSNMLQSTLVFGLAPSHHFTCVVFQRTHITIVSYHPL